MPRYEMRSIEDIKVSPFNPHARVDKAELVALLMLIQQRGIMSALALTKDGTLADGHRRLACAKILGIDKVPVAVYEEFDLDAPALWVLLNSGTKALTPAQWLAAVAAGLPVETENFPKELQESIVNLRELLGPEGFGMLADKGRSPGIYDTARHVASYCGRAEDSDFVRAVIFWFVDNRAQFAARTYIREQQPVDLLVEAIESGRSIEKVWELAD